MRLEKEIDVKQRLQHMSITRIRTIHFKDGHTISVCIKIPCPDYEKRITLICYRAGYSPMRDVAKITYSS